jgi:hypothetical protein
MTLDQFFAFLIAMLLRLPADSKAEDKALINAGSVGLMHFLQYYAHIGFPFTIQSLTPKDILDVLKIRTINHQRGFSTGQHINREANEKHSAWT